MKYVATLKTDNNVLIQGDLCCTDLKQLYTALLDRDTTDIEIRKDFTDKYFTYTGLCEFVENSAAIAPNVQITVLDTVYDTTLDAINELKSFTSASEFIYAMEHSPTKILKTIRSLCNYYTQSHEDMAEANNKIATMLVQIEDLQKQCNYLVSDCDKITTLHNDTEAKLHALVSRVNFRYEKTVNPDELFTIDGNRFNHVLYIKEITRVHYTDTLIYYLQEVLKTLYGVPARTVVIEPYYSYGKENLYPSLTPHWKLTYNDVYSGDIMMAGFQPKLMKDIMNNPNHVHYLIVLDRGGYMVPHLQSGNVSVVYTASTLTDISADVDPMSIISYSDKTLNIPYIEDFDTLSPELKIQKYSSMDVLKHFIELLEETKH